MANFSNDAMDSMVSYLDHVVKAGIAEPIDGLVFRFILKFIDSKLISKLPEEDVVQLNQSIVNIFDDNVITVDELETEVTTLSLILSKYIKTPLVDNTPEESAIIEGVLLIIIKSVELIIEKAKSSKAK
ncbi:MAG: hypothetical protein WCX94_02705 [Candidatus Dojkabacteria bacterium]|jgi:hypothetical protein